MQSYLKQAELHYLSGDNIYYKAYIVNILHCLWFDGVCGTVVPYLVHILLFSTKSF